MNKEERGGGGRKKDKGLLEEVVKGEGRGVGKGERLGRIGKKFIIYSLTISLNINGH